MAIFRFPLPNCNEHECFRRLQKMIKLFLVKEEEKNLYIETPRKTLKKNLFQNNIENTIKKIEKPLKLENLNTLNNLENLETP